MRETEFIGQNKDKWDGFEKVLQSSSADAERLSRVFIETTDDLSYSRTYYPNRSVRVYLNGIAQQIYRQIYKNQRKEKGAFTGFWVSELPDAVWHARKALLVSFLIFALGLGIGIMSSAHEPSFVNTILGDGYVRMTEENIAKGDPLGVYGNQGPIEMFFMIAWNNIRVGVLCFLLGLLFEVGTIFLVFSNAVMVGAFIWFFVQRDLFRESFFAIMLHGTLELSMIVLAGAAGLTLGRGLVFPGSYTRLQAFLLSARHGIRIMLGVSAFLIIAAFIEGFATRFTDAPDVIRGLIILLSLGIVLGYFVWYPWHRYRNGRVQEIVERETIEESSAPITADAMKTSGQMISESWRVYMSGISLHIYTALGCAALITALLLIALRDEFVDFFSNTVFYSLGIIFDMINGFWFWDETANFLNFEQYPLLYLPMAASTGLVLFGAMRVHRRFFQPNRPVIAGAHWLDFLNGLTAGCILLTPFFLPFWSWVITLINLLWWPFWLFTLVVAYHERRMLSNSIGQAYNLLLGTKNILYGCFFKQGLVLWAAMSIASAPLFYLIFSIVGSNIASTVSWSDQLLYILHSLIHLAALGFLLPVLMHTLLLLYPTALEVSNAQKLKQRIAQMTLKSKAYGLEKDL